MDEGEHMGRYCARIDDKPYPVMAHVDVYLLRLEKGATVDITLSKEGTISKIAKARKSTTPPEQFTTADRMKKAGFTVPNQSSSSPKEVMSESDVAALKARADEAQRERAHAEEMAAKSKEAKEKPKETPLNADVRSKPMTFNGTVSSSNPSKRILVIEDVDGITHGINYTAELDFDVQKQKPGWFVEITYCIRGDQELLMGVKYAERPANLKKKWGSGGGKPFTPRNEKIIVMQSSLKVCADLFQYCTTPDTQDYEAACDRVYNTALAMTERIMIDTVMK